MARSKGKGELIICAFLLRLGGELFGFVSKDTRGKKEEGEENKEEKGGVFI